MAEFDAIAFRRLLHSLPELSHKEVNTASMITKILEDMGHDQITCGIGGTGVVVAIRSAEEWESPISVFRSELDALPINEVAYHDHVSINKGRMHACGHDGHMASLLSLAWALRQEPLKKGTVYLLFQPAEEVGEGALAMVNDTSGTLTFRANFVFAYHNIPGYPLGQILIRDGTFACASTGVEIQISGKPSHAAYPENGISPTLAIAEFLQEVHRIPSIFPNHLAMCTICYMNAGEEAYGTAAGNAKICLTLRSDDDSVFNHMKRFVHELVLSLSDKYGLGCTLKWIEPFEATVNASLPVQKLKETVQALNLSSKELVDPMRWSEDFGIFSKKWEGAGAFFGIGSGESHAQLHNENYDFPDEIIPIATNIFTSLIQSIHQ